MSLWKIEIAIPNDGIVEEESNCLIPPEKQEAGYVTEKFAQIKSPAADHATYAHLPPIQACELTHVQIHNNPTVIRLVLDIAAQNRLDDWHAALPADWKGRFVCPNVPGLPRPAPAG